MNSNKNWLIGGLIAIIVIMAVGYAALSQELNIFGTATIDAEWNVEFTAITLEDSHGATEVLAPNFTATTATFEVTLPFPGAFAEYDIIVTNNGTIDAKVGSITINESEDVADVSYTVSGIAVDDELPTTAPNDTHTVTVRVEWDGAAEELPEDPAPLTETITVTIVYVQDTD